MPVSKCFSKAVKKYAERLYYTVLYDSYKKVLILYDELEKKQFDLYVSDQVITKKDGSYRNANDRDINKFALEKMKEIKRGDHNAK